MDSSKIDYFKIVNNIKEYEFIIQFSWRYLVEKKIFPFLLIQFLLLSLPNSKHHVGTPLLAFSYIFLLYSILSSWEFSV